MLLFGQVCCRVKHCEQRTFVEQRDSPGWMWIWAGLPSWLPQTDWRHPLGHQSARAMGSALRTSSIKWVGEGMSLPADKTEWPLKATASRQDAFLTATKANAVLSSHRCIAELANCAASFTQRWWGWCCGKCTHLLPLHLLAIPSPTYNLDTRLTLSTYIVYAARCVSTCIPGAGPTSLRGMAMST